MPCSLLVVDILRSSELPGVQVPHTNLSEIGHEDDFSSYLRVCLSVFVSYHLFSIFHAISISIYIRSIYLYLSPPTQSFPSFSPLFLLLPLSSSLTLTSDTFYESGFFVSHQRYFNLISLMDSFSPYLSLSLSSCTL